MSGRSLTMNSTPASRVQRRTSRAFASNSRSGSDFSRSWTTSTPPAAASAIVHSSDDDAAG